MAITNGLKFLQCREAFGVANLSVPNFNMQSIQLERVFFFF